MSSQWKKIAFQTPDIPTEPIENIIGVLRQTLNLILVATKAALAAARLINDPIVTTLEAIVKEVEDTLESLLDDVGGYVLQVPIKRRLVQPFYGITDVTPELSLPISALNPTTNKYIKLNDWQVFADPTLTEEIRNNDPGRMANWAASNKYAGGNAGFLNTVITSLYDQGDANRPQFNSDRDYVAGIVLLAGTNVDLLALLDAIMRLGLIFGGRNFPNFPRPQNLRAITRGGITPRTISNGTSDGTVYISLAWDPPPFPITSLTDLGGMNFRPVRYAILRGRNATALFNAKHVLEVFPTPDLTEGRRAGDIEVIKEGRYDATRVGYEDRITGVNAGDTFYYAVAWQLQAFGADEEIREYTGASDEKILPYGILSNIARASLNTHIGAGQRPDWTRTSSLREVVPPVAAVLDRIMQIIRSLASRIIGASQATEELLQFIENEINKYTSIAERILNEVERLLYLLQPMDVGIYAHIFYGQGGNQFLIQDLGTNLFNRNDPNAPPFWEGDEYVTGYVFMAGGRNPNVDVFVNAIGWLLGLKKGGSTRTAIEANMDTVTEAYDALEETWNRKDQTSGSLSGDATDLSGLLDNLTATFPESHEKVNYNDQMEETDEEPVEIVFSPDMCPLCENKQTGLCLRGGDAVLEYIESFKSSGKFNPDMTQEA